jgi:hypothetical protein
MQVAVNALVESPWHMGHDPKSTTTYNDWDKHLFKNVDKLEWWWNKAEGTARRKSA